MEFKLTIVWCSVLLIAIVIGRAGFRGLPLWKWPLLMTCSVLLLVFCVHIGTAYADWRSDVAREKREPPPLNVGNESIPGRYDESAGGRWYDVPGRGPILIGPRKLDLDASEGLRTVLLIIVMGGGLGGVLWVVGAGVRAVRKRRPYA